MESNIKTLTYAKIAQLSAAALAILVGYFADIFEFDSSICFYAFFLLSVLYVLFIVSREGIFRFLKTNRTIIVLLCVVLLSITVNYRYSDVYSLIRFSELFMFFACSAIYTGKEDLSLIRKFIIRIFRVITVFTFILTAASFFFAIFYKQFYDAGFEQICVYSIWSLNKWNFEIKHFVLSGLYHNSNQLGLNGFCSGFLSLYFIFTGRKKRIFDFINLIVQILGMIFSGCRSVLIVSGVLILMIAYLRGSKKEKAIMTGLFCGLLLLVAAVTRYKMGKDIYGGQGLEFILNQLSGNRYDIWIDGLKMFVKQPVFGVGLGNFNSAARHLLENSVTEKIGYINGHNFIINILSMTGIAGAVCWTCLFRDYYYGLKRVPAVLGFFCIGMVLADCFDIFLIFTDKLPSLLMPIIAGYGMQKQAEEEKPVYFFSNLVEEELYRKLYTKEERPGQQAQKFNRLIAEGFALNGRRVTACTSVLASDAIVDYKFRRFRNHDIYHYSLSINIPGIKTIWNILGAFFYTLFAEYGECAVDVLSIDNAIGALLAAKLRGMPSTGIVTDLPEHFSGDGLYAKIVYLIMNWCDSYVFLTTFMNDRLNPKNKPWIVMEGLCDVKVQPMRPAERTPSIIFAGEIDEQNGVLTMAEAFNQWGSHGYDLYFYGTGEAMERLKAVSEGNEHIHIMGLLLNRELLKIMEKASLLVNPRPIHQDFVKYSFPSKVMEYMNTGTYHASSRLACIPDEYFEYIGDLGDGSVQDILKFLKRFESMPEEYIESQAEKAQRFVLEKKNNRVQAGRILALLDGLL